MRRRWPKYVSVGKRKAKAENLIKEFQTQGVVIDPLKIYKGKIAWSFWGKAWCDHLQKFSDYENRLPRGRSYVRHGQVIHLDIQPGEIKALVSGTDLYEVRVLIDKIIPLKWQKIQQKCRGEISSLIELLQGNISDAVMDIVTDKEKGLFPLSHQIRFGCSCPDWATMCKHVASVLYGVGSRLDEKPELLFKLRGVDPQKLIAGNIVEPALTPAEDELATGDLENIFGIELDEETHSEELSPNQAKSSRAETKTKFEVESTGQTEEQSPQKRKPRRIIASVDRRIKKPVNPHFELEKTDESENDQKPQKEVIEEAQEEYNSIKTAGSDEPVEEVELAEVIEPENEDSENSNDSNQELSEVGNKEDIEVDNIEELEQPTDTEEYSDEESVKLEDKSPPEESVENPDILQNEQHLPESESESPNGVEIIINIVVE